MSCEETFVKQLRVHGLRYTPQREMVLQAVHEVEGHATAEEIYERVHNLSTCVDISTVYRTLELLQAFNLVAVVDLGDGQRRYEHLGTHGPHYHLVCRSCGKLVALQEQDIRPFTKAVSKAHGFAVDMDGTILPGICRECRTAEGEKRGEADIAGEGARK